MPYTTQQDLIDRYGEQLLISLTDRAAVATNVIDTDVVDQVLGDTDALIDGYLAARYKLPLAETPPVIAAIALKIAIYDLHVYQPNEKIENDYKEAIRQLKDIASGAIRLPVAGVEPENTGGSGARMTDRERPFTEDNMKGFI